MTTHQRYARACTTAALLLGAGAIACYQQPIPAAGLAYGAAVLAWCATREYGAHRRLLEEHEWARRRALGQRPQPLTPCCEFWRSSGGKVHGPDCPTLPGLEQANQELLDACCERWWTALETDHDPTCPTQTPRSNAA